MAKNEGKAFEGDIFKSIPEGLFKRRIKDDMGGFKGVCNDCDIEIFRKPMLVLMECKSHKGKSIPFTDIRDNQLDGLLKVSGVEGVRTGFIFNFRDYEESYWIKAVDVAKYIMEGSRKSFPIDWCREVGLKVDAVKKRTRYRYNIEKLLDEL